MKINDLGGIKSLTIFLEKIGQGFRVHHSRNQKGNRPKSSLKTFYIINNINILIFNCVMFENLKKQLEKT